jgi:hypothetical protein
MAVRTNMDRFKMDVGYDDCPRAIAGEGVEGPSGRSWGSTMRELASQDRVEWTLTHSLFVDIGGFVLRANTGRKPEALEMTDIGFRPNSAASKALLPLHDAESGFTHEPNAASRSKSSISVKDEAATETTPHHDPFHLTTTAILKLRRPGLLPKLPSITIDKINGKNKSDAFTRAISVIQIAWISIQVCCSNCEKISSLPTCDCCSRILGLRNHHLCSELEETKGDFSSLHSTFIP